MFLNRPRGCIISLVKNAELKQKIPVLDINYKTTKWSDRVEIQKNSSYCIDACYGISNNQRWCFCCGNFFILFLFL